MAERSPPAPVTVLGLGLMGAALARAFLAAGHPTTVWNRSQEKADPLVEAGASAPPTAAEAIAASEVVVASVADYRAVRAIVDAAGDALAGRVLVNLTSGTPDQARELAGRAGERGNEYLDGAIMAVPPAIGSPQALLLYSGQHSAYEASEAALAALGGEGTYLGTDPGLSSVYDLALLTMLWTATAGYLHALALVGAAGVAPRDFLPFATAWHENLLLPDLADTAAEVAERNYETNVSSIAVNKAGMDHLIEASEEAGVSVEVLAPIQALLDRQLSQGGGACSLSSLIELMRHRAPAPPA